MASTPFRSAVAGLTLLVSAATQIFAQQSQPSSAPTLIKLIAFGSCARQDKPQPIWTAINEQKPDLFLMIGDNIYGDSEDIDVLRGKYALLGAQPEFQKLRASCPILATWDDHDLGKNDAGNDYPKRKESQQLFFEFFNEPQNSPRRTHEGVYDASVYGPPGKRVQIILLDTRYNRDPLVKHGRKQVTGDGCVGPYGPNPDPKATVLGEAQWKWLDEQLRVPADLRIIATSIQFVSEEHGFEKWANFPHERRRLIDLLAKTRARGVVFISGDRHVAELSRMDTATPCPPLDGSAPPTPPAALPYPLYDLTSSSLNQKSGWYNEINCHRIGGNYRDPNFGVIEIDWSASDPVVSLQIRDEKGKMLIRHDLPLSRITPPKVVD